MQELNIIDYGDLAFDYAKVQEFPYLLEQHISKILSNNVSTIVLGGDHFITYPILKAYFDKLGTPYLYYNLMRIQILGRMMMKTKLIMERCFIKQSKVE